MDLTLTVMVDVIMAGIKEYTKGSIPEDHQEMVGGIAFKEMMDFLMNNFNQETSEALKKELEDRYFRIQIKNLGIQYSEN